MGKQWATKYALLLTLLTVTSAQYYDFFQGIQQIFQPYQTQTLPYDNRRSNTQKNRHDTKKNDDDDYILSKPENQFDYIFATTSRPNKKTTSRPNSSHKNNSRNNINNSNLYTEHTTKPNKVHRTTTIINNRYITESNNRYTTENNLNKGFNNNHGLTTENLYQNKRKENYENLQQKHVQGVTSNNRQTYDTFNQQPSGLNNNFKQFPTNTRNPDVQNIKPHIGVTSNYFGSNENSFDNSNDPTYTNHGRYDHNQDSGQSNFGGNFNTNTFNQDNYNHGSTDNFNRGNPNYDSNSDTRYINTDSRVNYDDNRRRRTTHNPLINRPGVRPAPVDNNAPPITNSPVTNNYWVNDRTTQRPRATERPRTSESPDVMPEILLGPDEDDMSQAQKRRYIEMGERMCDHFKSLTVRKVVALPLVPSPNPVEVNVSSCTPINVPLVIGGAVVTINEFPHMALVGWKKQRSPGYSWKCGGSLISDQYILTAGHCTYQDKDYDSISGPPQAVQLGSAHFDDPGAVVMKVSAVVRHPKYKQRRSYYDVALIKMMNKVTFSEVIRPACLGVPPRVGEKIIATGWGRTEFGGDHSNELRSVSLPVWELSECRDIWGTSLKLPQGVTSQSHMCAGDERGGKDTCQGDSGGPAQIQDGCVWRIAGVTSLGRACAAPRTPALYATLHRPFIVAAILE